MFYFISLFPLFVFMRFSKFINILLKCFYTEITIVAAKYLINFNYIYYFLNCKTFTDPRRSETSSVFGGTSISTFIFVNVLLLGFNHINYTSETIAKELSSNQDVQRKSCNSYGRIATNAGCFKRPQEIRIHGDELALIGTPQKR